MRVRATSRLLAVIGDPVGHSLSPAMHNAAIAALGLDAVFMALRAAPATFELTLRGILAVGGAACITVPHKRPAARLAEQPSELVRRTGACNAMWTEAGAVLGDNTDVAGVAAEARRLLAGTDEERPVRRALVLGTGGSARAAAVAIAEAWPGCEIAVASRDPQRAADFAAWGKQAGIGLWGSGIGGLPGVELAVNATPLGLKPDDPPPIEAAELKRLHPRAVLDLVYARGETGLVRAAREAGARAADGRGVLVAQGAAAFKRFFGLDAPVEVMRAAVEDALRP